MAYIGVVLERWIMSSKRYAIGLQLAYKVQLRMTRSIPSNLGNLIFASHTTEIPLKTQCHLEELFPIHL
jgi:hypothetical protein